MRPVMHGTIFFLSLSSFFESKPPRAIILFVRVVGRVVGRVFGPVSLAVLAVSFGRVRYFLSP